jgi:hypothetical protein
MNWACLPQLVCNRQWVELQVDPPRFLVAMAMQILMVAATERNGKLIADLSPQGARLREFEVVSIAGRLPADHARLTAQE